MAISLFPFFLHIGSRFSEKTNADGGFDFFLIFSGFWNDFCATLPRRTSVKWRRKPISFLDFRNWSLRFQGLYGTTRPPPRHSPRARVRGAALAAAGVSFRARGARLARREEGAYWAYVTEEQRRQVGCPARKALAFPLLQAISRGRGW